MSSLGLIAGLLGLIVIAAIARELAAVLLASAPREPREIRVGTAATAVQPIPRIIWTFWHAAPPSPFVKQCLANWQRFAPDHELRLLDGESLLRWIPADELRADFASLPPYRQADWLRIQLLKRYGGVWIDASTLLTRDLAWVHELQARQQVEYVGFYVDQSTSRPDLPIVENWFMAAQPACGFVRALADAFDHLLDIGPEANLERLRTAGRLEKVAQKLSPDFQRYLLMHMAASDLLDQHPQAYSLALLRAEDTAFAFHLGVGWRKRHLYVRLALTPCPARLPMLIKLRGGDRKVVERNLARGRWLRSSALARLLELKR